MARRFAVHLGLILCPALIFSLTTAGVQAAKPDEFKADLVILNGHVITVDEKNPYAQAIAIYGDKIIAVGDSRGIRNLIGENTKQIDATGKTVVPGFIESHMHPAATYPDIKMRNHIVNLFEIASMNDLVAALKAKADITEPEQWVRGVRYQDTKIGGHPTADILDRVSTKCMIYITHSSGHITAVNSLALKMAGITKDTSDHPAEAPNAVFGRNPDGTPNGVLYEGAGAYVLSKIATKFPVPTPEEERQGYLNSFKSFNARGLTSIADASCNAQKLGVYQAMIREGRFPIRMNAMMLTDFNEPAFQTNQNADDLSTIKAIKALGLNGGFGDSRLRMGLLKLFAGNSLSGRTCWVSQPYVGSHAKDNPPYFGIQHPLLFPPKGQTAGTLLDRIILEGHKAGFQWAVHSNGDKEIELLLDAYEKALKAYPRANHRHRIEHASVMRKDLLERAKGLGVIINFHPYLFEHGDKMTDFGRERFSWLFPYKTAIELGVTVAGHSDWSVSLADPLLKIQDMVTRKSKEGNVYGADQTVSPEVALRVWTLGNAYASFEENIKGSIEVGKLADIVILSGDPTKTNSESIKDIQVEKTILGGEIVYSR